MRAYLAILLLVVAGCHDLPDLGTCGNGVIEATNGEACDGDEGGIDTCNDRCELSCQTAPVTDRYVVVGNDPDLGVLYCPDERMTCALDGICRVGGGQFSTPGETQDFDVLAATVGDFDGDGIDDLVGSAATDVIVRFGTDRGGALLDSYTQPAPASQAPVAFFDRDPKTTPEGTSQLTMAVPNEGLALLTSNTESFLADLDASVALPNLATTFPVVVEEPFRAAGVLGDVPYEIARSGATGLTVKRLAALQIFMPEPTLQPCGTGPSTLVDAAVSIDRRTLVVVAKMAGANFDVCRYFHGPTDTAWSRDVTSLSGQAPDGVLLANLGGDACPELVLVARNMTVTGLSFLPATGGTCAFSNTRNALAPTLPLQSGVLAAGDVRPGLGADELVTTDGVVAVVGGTLQPVIGPTTADRPWLSAAVVDLDRDGVLDVVAGRANQDNVDVVRGGTSPNAYRAVTEAPVTSVVAADLDGDGAGDAALVEGAGGNQRVSVLYGRTSGPVGPAVPMVPFTPSELRLASLRSAGWPPSPRTRDGVEDLIVVVTSPGQTSAMAGLMFGEASGRLTVPRFPEPTLVDNLRGALAAGDLSGNGVAQVAILSNASTASGAGKSVLVNDVTTGAWSLTGLTGVTANIDPNRAPVRLRTKGAPLIAFGTSPGLAATDLSGHACTAPTSVFAGSRMRAEDVIGNDGIDELLTANRAARVPQIHVYPITTSGTTCSFGAEQWTELAGCSDVARVGTTVVALCQIEDEMPGTTPDPVTRWGLYRISETGERDVLPFAAVDGNGRELTVGDFDGDGIADLAVQVARGGIRGVQLVHQCPAYDERGCQ